MIHKIVIEDLIEFLFLLIDTIIKFYHIKLFSPNIKDQPNNNNNNNIR